MKRHAFTLIELLVVIAIIAILAAILFPVFAQAKAAAKQTANLSNVKNLALGVILYTSDSDDAFPLVQRYDPATTALFGLMPWQIATQPYIKSWGIFQHPLGPSMPTDAAMAAWKQSQLYGSMGRAANVGFTNYQATTSVGSFARRVCGSQACKYDGLFGNGCEGANCPWYGGTVNTSSLTTTSVGNPADAFLLGEGAHWDLFSNVSTSISNPCTYIVTWSPATYNANGTAGSMACPSARKNPKPQSPDGACSPSNLCDGFVNQGITNGMTTYAASDGHAVAKDYRGGLMATTTLADGSVVIKSMWPSGY